ncbi:diguanylate cyclase [Undibacterium jejuense]|uniref:diguanylate cyclase n=1 Tax=Undibacterium jejuense TaxID=1344949 RepID=A0A923KPK8_9BURK|nr:diguanylate cyclase [Undibacterium jejuense]MBC3861821.1 diguanylate cyclase [Undibacterium jejuense]
MHLSFFKKIWCALAFLAYFFASVSFAADVVNADQLLSETSALLRASPEKAEKNIRKLEEVFNSLTKSQQEKFYVQKAAFLGSMGRNKERIEFVEVSIKNVVNVEIQVKLLYQLSTGYTNLGMFESALNAMNQSIALLPKLTDVNTKLYTLQSAVSLFNTLKAFDQSLLYVEQISAFSDRKNSISSCVSLADKVEIEFLRGNREVAKNFLPDAIQDCKHGGNQFMVKLLNALDALDLIKSSNFPAGISSAKALLDEADDNIKKTNYFIELENALARAYIETGDLKQADFYANEAYKYSNNSKVYLLIEQANETMSKIKRAQGQYVAALEFDDTALEFKNKLLDEQLQKNIAYQRVKFDMQDKANQLTLLEQKNKLLSIEKQLDKKNNEVLLLFIGLIVVALLLVGVWLWKVIQQKNIFKRHAQVDALTQISNRRHFIDITTAAVAERTAPISLILFDMDFFKKINDNFGHPTGDWVLIHVCQAVTEVLRKGDMFGRLGGEEFAICMPAADTHVAKQLAERCRLAIAAIDTEPSGFRFPLTASFGIATIDTYTVSTFEALMESADKALYKSKADGRNCVSVFE